MEAIALPTINIQELKYIIKITIFVQNTTTDSNQSYSNTINDDKVIRNKILDAALSHVDNLGWTTDALAQAIKENNHQVMKASEPSPTSNVSSEGNGGPLLHGIFDRGAFDLVHHFLEKKRQHVLNTATVEVRM